MASVLAAIADVGCIDIKTFRIMRNQFDCAHQHWRMPFDFVVETPQRRGVNRHNDKIIQKRATQAGARTRLRNNSKQTTSKTVTNSVPYERIVPNGRALLANAALVTGLNPPFLTQFGTYGQIFFMRDQAPPRTDTNHPHLADSNISVLQRQLKLTTSGHPIATNSERMFKVMMLTSSQFLEHLPAHYGKLTVLDEAINCLVARLQDIVPLIQHSPSAINLSRLSPAVSYGRALTALRSIIDQADELSKDLHYTWFAVLLLTLFELLTPEDEPLGWICHAAGAARILYEIGPENIKSEFHLSLLSSQCRLMVVETIFGNKPCYLAEPRWHEALQRTILDKSNFSDRSRASTELWMVGTKIPAVFQTVSHYVHGSVTSNAVLARRIAKLLASEMGIWKRKWQSALEDMYQDVLQGDIFRHQSLTILLSFYMLSIIICRLRIAVNPAENIEVEDEALGYCASILSMCTSSTSSQRSAQEIGSIEVKVANGTQQSALEWKEGIGNATRFTAVDARIFDNWCGSIGRAA